MHDVPAIQAKAGMAYMLSFDGIPVSKLKCSVGDVELTEGKHFVPDLPCRMVYMKAIPKKLQGCDLRFSIEVRRRMVETY